MKAYHLKTDAQNAAGVKAGTIAYPISGYDYGCASDDSHFTGIEHISVSLDKAGGYPFFTIPVRDLEDIQVDDLPHLTEDHVKEVCRPGSGAETCRYLTMSRGWSCAKLSAGLRLTLDSREDMVARGDNCEGRTSNA